MKVSKKVNSQAPSKNSEKIRKASKVYASILTFEGR